MADLLTICIAAFIAVFVLLSLLAIIMWATTHIFPMKEQKTDAALIGAITTTYQTIYPNTKITKIEEIT
jgi:hypothetical protein